MTTFLHLSSSHFLSSFTQVLRDGDHQAPGHRGLQTPSSHSQRGSAHLRVQARVSIHLCLGDQGQAAVGRGVQQRQCAQRKTMLSYKILLFVLAAVPVHVMRGTEADLVEEFQRHGGGSA